MHVEGAYSRLHSFCSLIASRNDLNGRLLEAVECHARTAALDFGQLGLYVLHQIGCSPEWGRV